MKPIRLKSLPENIRREIKDARLERGWSQLKLGDRAGLTQRHVSGIETGKITPRYDTLIEILRVLDRDLVLVARPLLPAVQALMRDYRNQTGQGGPSETPLYAVADDDGDDAAHQPELGDE
ncbi:MAG: helix-turn-helix transcriptional regulator [Alphaproteobacteria bacterium]|jgi:transcriptional regulator with XRE-family HTH domain|nr:helix-turn-helix transcriptional regulator [Alphaproteobacteria bacterium]MDP6565075.1 helix-turn-helix transcriptional regulator [Alphaproteobacteria bacterium]